MGEKTMGMRLDADDILIAEFQYVAQTAFQVNEDRARVSTLYFVSVGSLVAAILTSQVMTATERSIFWAFAGLLGLLSLASVLALLQLVRLREAWLDSVSTMNEIKDFYARHMPELSLNDAFRWRKDTSPARRKLWSISSLMAFQVSLLGGGTLGAAVMFAGLGFCQRWWGIATTVGIVAFVLQVVLYWRLLGIECSVHPLEDGQTNGDKR